MTVDRVNFIERELFVFTYRKILWAGVLFILLLCLTYGLQWARAALWNSRVSKMTALVAELKTEQEKRLAEAEARFGTGGEKGESLRQSFERSPRWAASLMELTKKMPSGTWLVSLKSYARESVSTGRGLLLMGEAEEPRQVSLLLQVISGSPYFENPVLQSSKQEMRGTSRIYTYTIDTGLAVPPWGGVW